jgi:hypothetical protein
MRSSCGRRWAARAIGAFELRGGLRERQRARGIPHVATGIAISMRPDANIVKRSLRNTLAEPIRHPT